MLEQKQEYKTIEYSIGCVVTQKKRGKNRENQINQVVELLKQIQRERNITDMSKKFLNNILKDFLNDRARQRVLLKILDKAISQKERTINHKFLIQELHHEKVIKGDLSKIKRYGINWAWRDKYSIDVFYSFL